MFAGYFSKDAIIEVRLRLAQSVGVLRFLMTVAAAGLTAFYSWRLIFKTFFGEPHDQDHYEAARESPLWMLIPIGVSLPADPRGFPVQGIVRRPQRGRVFPRVRQDAPHIIGTCPYPRGDRDLPTV